MNELDRLKQATTSLAGLDIGDCAVAIVLGSGLKGFADSLAERVEVPFDAVPHWPNPLVEGHGASLVLGTLGGARIACLRGRVHLYEGHHPSEVVRAVRTLRLLGVPRFVLTNAAGGISSNLQALDLMRIRDHLNMTGRSALVGPHVPEFGPRFPDQTSMWSPALAQTLHAVDPGLKTGVYAGLLGPSYETPAEITWLKAAGADAVGMSTVLEATALHAMGAELAGISLISNLAAGIADKALDHQEVVAAGEQAASRFASLLDEFCRTLA